MTSHALRVVLVIGIVIFFWMLMTSSQRSGDGFTTVGVGRGGPCDPSNPTAQCSPGGACSQLELCDLGQGCFTRRGEGWGLVISRGWKATGAGNGERQNQNQRTQIPQITQIT